jgi:hypothetical protein
MEIKYSMLIVEPLFHRQTHLKAKKRISHLPCKSFLIVALQTTGNNLLT